MVKLWHTDDRVAEMMIMMTMMVVVVVVMVIAYVYITQEKLFSNGCMCLCSHAY